MTENAAANQPGLVGIRGWLLVFGIRLFAGLAYAFVETVFLSGDSVDRAFGVVNFVITFALVGMFCRHHHRFVAAYTTYVVLTGVLVIVALTDPEIANDVEQQETMGFVLAEIVAVGYLLTSRRVKNTFRRVEKEAE